MNRRAFVRNLSIGMGVVSTLGIGFYYKSKFQSLLENILKKDLKGLKVNEKDIESFSKEASLQNPWGYSNVKIKFIALYDTVDYKYIPLPYKQKYYQYRADIVGRFLLSTNFFTNKMDESKDIIYAGIVYTPYNAPCYNPFSNLYYPS